MSALSLERYRALVDDSPVPVRFDREPRRAPALHPRRARGGPARGGSRPRVGRDGRAGRGGGRRAGGAAEPALVRDVAAAWLVDQGRRIDPAALTVAHALRARELGAEIRRHAGVRALTTAGDRVTGVVTDEGVVAAGTVVLAAGPWSAPLVRPLGVTSRHGLPRMDRGAGGGARAPCTTCWRRWTRRSRHRGRRRARTPRPRARSSRAGTGRPPSPRSCTAPTTARSSAARRTIRPFEPSPTTWTRPAASWNGRSRWCPRSRRR